LLSFFIAGATAQAQVQTSSFVEPVTGMAIPLPPGYQYVPLRSGCGYLAEGRAPHQAENANWIGACKMGLVDGLGKMERLDAAGQATSVNRRRYSLGRQLPWLDRNASWAIRPDRQPDQFGAAVLRSGTYLSTIVVAAADGDPIDREVKLPPFLMATAYHQDSATKTMIDATWVVVEKKQCEFFGSQASGQMRWYSSGNILPWQLNLPEYRHWGLPIIARVSDFCQQALDRAVASGALPTSGGRFASDQPDGTYYSVIRSVQGRTDAKRELHLTDVAVELCPDMTDFTTCGPLVETMLAPMRAHLAEIEPYAKAESARIIAAQTQFYAPTRTQWMQRLRAGGKGK
jgi:hypothetical protein